MYLKLWTEFSIEDTKACWQPLLNMLDREAGNNSTILLAFGYKLDILKLLWI